MTDTELVEASRRGERDAFGHLVARYQDVVCAVSYSSTGDWSLSEDVAQDTFIAAWRQLGQLRETVRIRSWLCGIARNLARKARKHTARDVAVDDELPAIGASPFDQTAQAEVEQVVRDALSRVPDTYREALVLFYRENQSVRDVAASLEITEAAALQRLARGRKYMADGVTDLVERSLTSARTKRNLAACVIAALPALAIPSRVDASTTKGSTMLKLAIAAIALSAAGTAALVHHSRAADATSPIASNSPVASETRNEPARPAGAPTGTSAPSHETPRPSLQTAEPPVIIPPQTIEKLHLDRGPSRGPEHARVTIILFQDLICPYCGNVLGTIDQLWEEYPGNLRLVIKQFPVHDKARLAAEASFAADAQGKFWDLHDLMLQHQDDLSRDALIGYAQQAGLDVATFTAALDHHTYATALADDVASAKAIDVNATPTFLVNGQVIQGARPIAVFRTAIEAALAN